MYITYDEMKHFNVKQKYQDNFLNCLMRKTILQFECKTVLMATFCEFFLIKTVTIETNDNVHTVNVVY
mgnify:CR=1 FL=1